MNWITLKTFDNSIDANMVANLLDSEGIEVFLKDEHTMNVNPIYNYTIGGVKLQVKEEDKVKAVEVLTANGYLKLNITECPNCKSINVVKIYKEKNSFSDWLNLLASALMLKKNTTPYFCKNCNTQFSVKD